MKIRVNPHNIEIVREQTEPINELEIKVSKCEFEFDEAITDEFVKEAYFTLNGSTYKQIIVNNECDYPSEVLAKKGTLEIGVVAFKVENGEEIIRYNPSPDYFDSWVGSLKDADNSEPITPSEMEQFEQELQNGLNDITTAIENAERLDVDVSKVGNKTTVTITKQDGSTDSEDILDGEDGTDGENGIGLQYDWLGTSLGVKREDEALFTYVNLEGKKGDPGAINLLIVNELPLVGSEDTLYFVPKEDTEESDMYDEYVWINNDWELVGTKQITVDLSDYYTKTQTNNLLNGKIDDVQINESSIVSDNIANISVTGSYSETDSPLLSLWDVTIDGSIPIGADEDSIDINTTSGNYDGSSVLLVTNDTLESEYVPIDASVTIQGTNYSSSINNVGNQINFSLMNNTTGDSNHIVLTPTETYIGNINTPQNNRDAVNKKYVDDIVGDIGTILDNINGEVIGG